MKFNEIEQLQYRSIELNYPLSEIENLFFTSNVTCLPVTKDRKLIGLLHMKNVLHAKANNSSWTDFIESDYMFASMDDEIEAFIDVGGKNTCKAKMPLQK